MTVTMTRSGGTGLLGRRRRRRRSHHDRDRDLVTVMVLPSSFRSRARSQSCGIFLKGENCLTSLGVFGFNPGEGPAEVCGRSKAILLKAVVTVMGSGVPLL